MHQVQVQWHQQRRQEVIHVDAFVKLTLVDHFYKLELLRNGL
jgi:hypothetical protein